MKKRRSASAAVKKTYLALVLAFLYVPIVVMIALSFNASVSSAEWTGFTLNWYKKLLQREDIIAALRRIRWWDWSHGELKQRLRDFDDVAAFCRAYDPE